MRIMITLALLFTAGCTCNEGGNPAAGPRVSKVGKHAKMKGKRRGKVKGKRKAANIPKVTVGLWFVDEAKIAAGEEDAWVKVEREVGAKTPAKNAVWQLMKGPMPDESAKGLKLYKSDAAGFKDFEIEGNTAKLALRDGCNSGGSTVTVWDHLEKTLKEFPEIEHVKLYGPDGDTQDAEGEGDSRPECLEP